MAKIKIGSEVLRFEEGTKGIVTRIEGDMAFVQMEDRPVHAYRLSSLKSITKVTRRKIIHRKKK